MIELNRIERAIQTVALLIQETGEMYWPILERLELERDLRQSRQIRLSNYLASSQKTLPPRGRGLSRPGPNVQGTRPSHSVRDPGDGRTGPGGYGHLRQLRSCDLRTHDG